MSIEDDPFGFVGPSKTTTSNRVEQVTIVARPGQEYRIIIDDGSGRFSPQMGPAGDQSNEAITSRSPSPDGDSRDGFTSQSPSPDRCYPDEA